MAELPLTEESFKVTSNLLFNLKKLDFGKLNTFFGTPCSIQSVVSVQKHVISNVDNCSSPSKINVDNTSSTLISDGNEH